MGGFADTVAGWEPMVLQRMTDVVTECGVEVHRSMVEGSELTGAPGQPIQDGDLRRSFVPERIDPLHWQDTTDLPYARKIENGIAKGGPMTLRSAQGGWHSIAMTRLAWEERIVPAVVARVVTK